LIGDRRDSGGGVRTYRKNGGTNCGGGVSYRAWRISGEEEVERIRGKNHHFILTAFWASALLQFNWQLGILWKIVTSGVNRQFFNCLLSAIVYLQGK